MMGPGPLLAGAGWVTVGLPHLPQLLYGHYSQQRVLPSSCLVPCAAACSKCRDSSRGGLCAFTGLICPQELGTWPAVTQGPLQPLVLLSASEPAQKLLGHCRSPSCSGTAVAATCAYRHWVCLSVGDIQMLSRWGTRLFQSKLLRTLLPDTGRCLDHCNPTDTILQQEKQKCVS